LVDAPAGRVKRKKGSELTIDISESSRVEYLSIFKIQIAVVP